MTCQFRSDTPCGDVICILKNHKTMFIHRDKRAAVYDKNTGAILARAKHWQSLLLIVWLYILERSCSANTFPLAEAQGSDATNQSAFSFSFSFLDTCIDL